MADNYLDKAGATYLAGKVKELDGNKVDKVDGKGLSTNDYTTEEKTKLSGIEVGAEVNVNPDWNAVTGKSQILNKPTIPTTDTVISETSENPVQNKVVKKYVDDMVAGVTGVDFKIVSVLPATGEKGTIYLVPKTAAASDIYDEYIWVVSAWEKIGSTNVDLSDYLKKTDMVPITNAEIDAMFS